MKQNIYFTTAIGVDESVSVFSVYRHGEALIVFAKITPKPDGTAVAAFGLEHVSSCDIEINDSVSELPIKDFYYIINKESHMLPGIYTSNTRMHVDAPMYHRIESENENYIPAGAVCVFGQDFARNEIAIPPRRPFFRSPETTIFVHISSEMEGIQIGQNYIMGIESLDPRIIRARICNGVFLLDIPTESADDIISQLQRNPHVLSIESLSGRHKSPQETEDNRTPKISHWEPF